MKNSKDLLSQKPLGINLSKITKQYIGVLSSKLSHLDIERYYYPLVLIEKSGNKLTQQQLADHLCSDKVSMVRVIDYLSKKGYVKRKQNADDRREYFLELTEKGRCSVGEVEKAIYESNREAFSGITEREIEIFFNLLTKIACNLSVLPSEKVDLRYRRLKK